MALTQRLRLNGLLCGTLKPTLGAALTNSGTTITFPAALNYGGGIAVPSFTATQYLPLTLEPDTSLEEIIWLSGYSSGATTGTIARGQEGTTGVAHSSSANLVHGPTALDGSMIPLAASPGPPTTGAYVAGQMYLDSNGTQWSCTVAGTPGSWTASAGQPPGVVPATRIIAVGHSWLTGFGSSTLDRGLASQLAGATGASVDNFSIAGSMAAGDDVGAPGKFIWWANGIGCYGWVTVLQEPALIPKRISAPRGPNGFIGWTVYGINDVGNHHGDTGNNPLTAYKNAMRTIISRLSAAQVYEDSDASVVFGGGTWQTVGFDWTVQTLAGALPAMIRMNSGVSYRPFPANTATFTITLPADFEGGTVAVGLIAYPNSDATVTWSGTASGATGSISLAGQAYNSNLPNAQRSSNVGVVARLACTAADANKTIIGTISAMSATALATPAAPGAITHAGTTGAATYTYAWVAGDANGDTVQSTVTSTANGNATLSGTNTNVIPAPAFPSGATYMKLVRTATSGASGNGATLGLIALIISSVAVTDNGIAATAYTAATANPLLTGGAFDYWQIEDSNPTAAVVVSNICRLIPGGMPQVGGTGGYVANQGYCTYPSLGTTAITAGGTVAATTVTINYAGLTAAQQASIRVGGVVQLTGGTGEAFYINAINTGTGVITLSTSPTSQVGSVQASGHTTVAYGYPDDIDVNNWNTGIQALVAEFPNTVQYANGDASIALNTSRYYGDGLHLNDRGCAIVAGSVAQQIGQIAGGLQPFQVASLGRKARKPENVVSLWYSAYGCSWGGIPGDLNVTSTVWTNLVDTLGNTAFLTIGASPGDLLEIQCSGQWANQAPGGLMDACTWTGSAVINSCTTRNPASYFGAGCWYNPGGVYSNCSGSIYYPVQPADIASSYGGYYVSVLLRVQATTAAGKTLYMNTVPFYMTLKNLGRQSYSGSI